jgi:hypothetical protein
MLVALKQKITEKKDTYSSLEELQLDIASIHPSFGKLIIDALKRPGIAISVVLTPIQIWISLAQNEPIRVENVFFGPTTIVERPLYHRGSPTQSSPPAPLPVTLHPGDPIRAQAKAAVRRWFGVPRSKPPLLNDDKAKNEKRDRR